MGTVFSGNKVYLVVRSVAYESSAWTLGIFINPDKAREVANKQNMIDRNEGNDDITTIVIPVVLDKEEEKNI